MSDGKRSVKRDVVILSIKPRRPEYPSDKKYVLAKEVLQEWDKLDAYYRGQILKLKTQAKSHASRKSSKRSSSKKSSSSISSQSRRSISGGHQLTELFGDENIPFNDDEQDLDLEQLSSEDDENTQPKTRHHNKLHNNDIKKVSLEKKSQRNKCNSLKTKYEDDENYLSVPRDNFVIEFAISLKKRTPLHRPDHCNSGSLQLSPIKVEPYKPPVAIGFNGVHIQKILYHKSDGGVNNTSPTTTVPTPEKPPDNESNDLSATSPLLIITSNESKRESSSTTDDTTNGIESPHYTDNKVEDIKIATKKKKPPMEQQRATIKFSSPPLKRKLGQDSYNNNGPVSSTTGMPEDQQQSETRAKKPSIDKIIIKKPSLTSRSCSEKDSNSNKLLENNRCKSPRSLSITDKIIRKAKELPPDLMERERRRKLEIEKRKIYALEKRDEHKLLDSLDVSMKAFEMIFNGRIVSPLRSPPPM